ncbi:MAG: hypothetical protein JO153_07350 [Solirubrobacterales bacterium]|nr:hypothetical protein [Solirubrobacterales bacterium]
MDDLRGLGRSMFAAVLLLICGALNAIWGVAAIRDSDFFAADRRFIFGDLNGWGWITLILGILQIAAAVSLWRGNTFGRVFAIVMASLVAIAALLEIRAYPFWSLAIFALTLWIIHGLMVYASDDAAGATAEQPAAGAGSTRPRRR